MITSVGRREGGWRVEKTNIIFVSFDGGDDDGKCVDLN